MRKNPQAHIVFSPTRYVRAFFLLIVFLVGLMPIFSYAANNDPFRGGRGAVKPPMPVGTVSQSTGAMNFVYQMKIPPGRNGVAPDLSVNYSSADKRSDSLFGYGWSLSLPYIERVNKIGTNNLYNQDRDQSFFLSSLSGELLPKKNSIPTGGGFLAASFLAPFEDLFEAPVKLISAINPIDTSEGPFSSIPDASSVVSSRTALSFHTFDDPFTPFVYHPKYEEEFERLKEEASRDARISQKGYRMIEVKPLDREILEERTDRTKVFSREGENGEEKVYHLFPQQVHYRDQKTGQYEDIDSRIVDSNGAFTVDKAPYQLEVSKTQGSSLFTFSHGIQALSMGLLSPARFLEDSTTTPLADLILPEAFLTMSSTDMTLSNSVSSTPATSSVLFDVGSLIIDDVDSVHASSTLLLKNEELSQDTLVLAVDKSHLVRSDEYKKEQREDPLEIDLHRVIIPDSVLPGVTLEITAFDTAVSKEVVFATPDVLAHFADQTSLSFAFDLTANVPIELLDASGVSVEEGKSITTSSQMVIQSNDGVQTYIYPPFVKDAIGKEAPIEITYTKTPSGFQMEKHVPTQFLKEAVYPVRTDATLGSNPLSGDGYVRHSNGTWSGVHDASQGTNAWQYTTGIITADSIYDSGSSLYYNGKIFLPFDTSAIPDSATIATATLKIYPDSRTIDNQTSQNYIVLVGPTTQASTSTLASSDYNKCGATTSPTLLSNTITWQDSWPVGGSTSFTLNTTGIAAVSKTGTTYLGLRTGFDTENVAPTAKNIWSFKSGDYGVSSERPYLEIITTNNAPGSLRVENLTNPSNIATTSPAFSAVFYGLSATDTTQYFRLQVSTSSTFASLVADSGKVALSSTTANGSRTPNFYATTTFAVDGTKYYWRAKFWNQGSVELDWSGGTDYFIMQLAGDYMAKVDDGSFMKYTLATSGAWTVLDKRGWKYTFGATNNARLHNPSATSTIYRWYLEEVTEPNGNKILYNYTKDQGQVYPNWINYTDRGGGGLFQVNFTKSFSDTSGFPNAPFATSSMYGFPVFTRYLISDITANVNGIPVRRYTPKYTLGDNGGRLLLSGITEKGYSDTNGTGEIALPPTNFSYYTSTTTWTEVTNPSSYQMGFDVSNTASDDFGWRLFDINGDALPDWVRSDASAQTTLLNTGTKWSTSTAWNIPVLFSSGNQEQGVRMAEVNGDGIMDLIAASSSKIVYLGNGTSTWVASSTWVFPESIIDSANRDLGVQLVDVNGDGLADVLRAYYASTTGTTTKVYTNTGSGWVEDSGWTIPEVLINDLRDTSVRLYDYNGDGLIDILYSPYPYSSSAVRVYYNTGRGWQRDGSVLVPFAFSDATVGIGSADRGVRFADVNGDGCVDMVQGLSSLTKDVRLSNCSSGWSTVIQNTLPEFFRDSASDYGVRMDDIDGDGNLDITRSFYDTGAGTRVRKVYLKNGEVPDLLKEVSNTRSGKTSVEYRGTPEYRDGSGNLLNALTPFVAQTVRALGSDNGSYLSTQRTLATTTYEYQRGYYYGTGTSPFERKFAGFGLVQVTSPTGNVTKTYFHQGNGTDVSNGEYGDHISKAGRPYRIEQYDQSSNLFARTMNAWGRADFADGRNFVKLGRTLSQTFDGDSTHRDIAASTTYDNLTGNVSTLVEYGEVLGNSDGTWTDIGTDGATTTYLYAASSTNSTMSLPSRVLVTDQAGATVRDTKWTYDGLAFGSMAFGNPTKEEMLVSGSTYASSTKSYDVYGNVSTSTDPRGYSTGYYYTDGRNLFPNIVRNPLLQDKLFSYDYSVGKAATTTDENNQTVATVLDNLDRPIQEKQPDFSSPSTLLTRATYTYTDATTTPSSVFRRDYITAGTSTDSYTYLDGFDRTLTTRTEAEPGNGWIAADTLYDLEGRVATASLSYFTPASTYASPTTSASLLSTQTYDALGRAKTITDVFGTTGVTYSDWFTRSTDPLGNTKDTLKDARGNLVAVGEKLSSSQTATTTYVWNLNKRLTKSTDALGNVRNFTYDNLGRNLVSEDLHAPADVTFGTTTSTYDIAGNVIALLNPRAQTTNYTYDALGRVLTEDFTGQSGTEITYGYDTCLNGKGRRCGATTTDMNLSYEYNPLGLIVKEVKKITGSTFVTTHAYDRGGNETILTTPDNTRVIYEFDDGGYLSSVYSKSGTQATTSVVTRLDYAPTGAIAYREYANGVKTTQTFDPTQKYRLTRSRTTGIIPRTLIQEGSLFANPSLEATSTATTPIGWNSNSWGTNNATFQYPVTGDKGAYGAKVTITSYTSGDAKWYPNRVAVVASTTYLFTDRYQSTATTSIVTEYSNAQGTLSFAGLLNLAPTGTSTWATTTLLFTPPSGTVAMTMYHLLAATGTLTTDNLVLLPTYGSVNVFQNPALDIPAGNSPQSWYQDVWGTNTTVFTYPTVSSSSIRAAKIQTTAYTNGDAKWRPIEVPVQGGKDYVYTDEYNSAINTELSIAFKDNLGNYTYGGYFIPSSGGAWATSTIIFATPTSTVSVLANHLLKGVGSLTIDNPKVYSIPVLDDRQYAYDAVGNITRVINQSDTATIGTTTYTYDTLYRLTSASTTGSAVSPWKETYAYDALGNMLAKGIGGATTYTYASTGYANPHAATQIGSTAYTFDQSGNTLTGEGTYSWTYRNTLATSTGGGTTTYLYDPGNQRIYQRVGTGTPLLYPSSAYLQQGATSTTYIQVAGMTLAEITGSNATATITFLHPDYLNSTSFTTDISSTPSQTLVYSPYGSTLASDAPQGSTRRQFIGQATDPQTALSYLNARYYQGSVGRFLSEDPILQGPPALRFLLDPQQVNAYGYARNNPINGSDPSGESFLGAALSLVAKTLNVVGNILSALLPTVARAPTFDAPSPVRASPSPIMSLNGGQSSISSSAVVGGAITATAAATVAILTHNPVATKAIVSGGKTESALVGGAVTADRTYTTMISNVTVADTKVGTLRGTVDLGPTLQRIESGTTYPHVNDGSIWLNKLNNLPIKPTGYYREYVVPTPGNSGPGAQRIISGFNGERWYTPDHYESFINLSPE